MNYWLATSEPVKYSWEKFVADGRAVWDGVRNYGARNNLRAMAVGDRVLYYHSNEGLAVVGIAEVVKEAYQDPTTEDTNWVVVDLIPVAALSKPVTLAQIKADAICCEMELVRQSRLSVSKVTEIQFARVLDLAGGLAQ